LAAGAVVEARYRALEVKPPAAGGLFAAAVTVEGVQREGLAGVQVTVGGKARTRWVWLRPREHREVVFPGLTAAPGTCEVRAGDQMKSFTVGVK
jgi:hypothetical protein